MVSKLQRKKHRQSKTKIKELPNFYIDLEQKLTMTMNRLKGLDFSKTITNPRYSNLSLHQNKESCAILDWNHFAKQFIYNY